LIKNDKIIIIFYVFLAISFSVAIFYINSTYETTSLPNIIPKPVSELEIIKEVDIEKEKIFLVMTDLENYPKVLPRNIKSIDIIEQSDNVILAEYTVVEAGVYSKLLVQHKMYPYYEHVMEVMDGDAKETKVTQKFTDINSITTINTIIEFDLKGILSPFSFLPKGNLEHAANTILTNFIDYAQISENETKKIVDDLYREILLRPADTEAFEYWVPLLENGSKTETDIRTEILNSDEKKHLLSLQEMKTVDELELTTKKIVDDLYREILLRPADTEAFEYWGSLLENENITKLELRKSILKSQEAIDLKRFDSTSGLIKSIFNEILNRDPTVSESSHYKYLVDIEEITEEQIRLELEELKNFDS
jgi:ribosome-associated toxin RatA of RatAB toxin-antitoxin module